MNASLVCCLTDVGGIGERGDFWVGCGDVQGGSTFCAGVWWFSVAGWSAGCVVGCWLLMVLEAVYGMSLEEKMVCGMSLEGHWLYLLCWVNVHPLNQLVGWNLNQCLLATVYLDHYLVQCQLSDFCFGLKLLHVCGWWVGHLPFTFVGLYRAWFPSTAAGCFRLWNTIICVTAGFWIC